MLRSFRNLSIRQRIFCALALAVFSASPASSTTLLVNQRDPYSFGEGLAYGYGLSQWPQMTDALNSAFGTANITVSASRLDNLAAMLAYDRLWITMSREAQSFALTPFEQNNVAAFIATGRRVVLIGENSDWAFWNASILAPVGGTFSSDSSSIANVVLNHPLTAGVNSIQLAADGIAIGGVPLFSRNVATLWGSSQNALSVLSVNILGDINATGNVAFRANLAGWLAAPEPTCAAMSVWAMIAALHRARTLRKSRVERQKLPTSAIQRG